MRCCIRIRTLCRWRTWHVWRRRKPHIFHSWRSRRWQGRSGGCNAVTSEASLVHAILTVCAATTTTTTTSTAAPSEPEGRSTSPPSRSRHIRVRRHRPETFASHQREVIGVQLAIRHSLFQLALLLYDARVCWPAAFTLRDPCCDFFGRIESHVRA